MIVQFQFLVYRVDVLTNLHAVFSQIFAEFMCSGDQPNSTSEILEATVKYVQKLKTNQKQMFEVKDRVEQLEKMQRKLLLQRQVSAVSLLFVTGYAVSNN